MNIAVISNGHGEDAIATTLCLALRKQDATVTITAYPLVGSGLAFKKHQIPCGLQNPVFPSGGFIRSVGDLWRDIKQGLLSHLWRQYHRLRRAKRNTNYVLAVGDVFSLCMARLTSPDIYFFPTAKSDRFMPHSWLERLLIRRFAHASFPRDKKTTTSFKQHRLPAYYFGNPMMDHLVTQRTVLSLKEQEQLIGIFPGSRAEGTDNATYLFPLLTRLKVTMPQLQLACAWPATLCQDTLSNVLGWSLERTGSHTLIHDPLTKHAILLSSDFLAVANQSHCIVGLAGTANEQAVFLGKPVICFPGFGPQSSARRFTEQALLLGPLLHFVPTRTPGAITLTLKTILKSSQATAGTKPSKNQDAAANIITTIRSLLPLTPLTPPT